MFVFYYFKLIVDTSHLKQINVQKAEKQWFSTFIDNTCKTFGSITLL